MRVAIAVLLVGTLVACGSRNKKTQPESTETSEASVPVTPDAAASPDASAPPEIPSPTPDAAPSSEAPIVPDNQTAVNPGKTGAFKVLSYTAGLTNSAYQSAIIFYPADTTRASYPATTLSGGYTNTKEQMVWLGRHLASHGIITLVFTPTNTFSTDPRIWATGHEGALDQLEKENQRADSPLVGRVDTSKLGIMGFSMGGAGTVLALNKLGTRVKAAVGLCAYNPAVLKQSVPLLHISGTLDTVASPTRIEQAVKTASNGSAKAFAKIEGMRHQDVAIGGSRHENIARYATAWYKVYLGGETAFKTWLSGDELKIYQE